MKGNTFQEFMSDLYANGGPEKEFVWGDKYYLIQADSKENDDKTYIHLDVYERKDNEGGEFLNSFWFAGDSLEESVDAFAAAAIFDGKTIYEAEKDIIVFFG